MSAITKIYSVSKEVENISLFCSGLSNSLASHGPQHAHFPCPSSSPRPYSNSWPSSQRCHPTVLSSFASFPSCLQSSPLSGSSPVSQFFASGGQSIGASASISVLPMNIQCLFPLGLTGLVSLLSKELSGVFSSTIWKHQFFSPQSSLWSSSHICIWLLEKP